MVYWAGPQRAYSRSLYVMLLSPFGVAPFGSETQDRRQGRELVERQSPGAREVSADT